MFPPYIKENLQFFEKEKYQIVELGGEDNDGVTKPNNEVVLEERKKEGKASLKCTMTRCSIILASPEKNVLPYLNDSSRSCADKFIYQKRDNSRDALWDLHIIEFKRTVNFNKYMLATRQFRMGIYNARAIAAFLGIKIGSIVTYIGYRNDNLSFYKNRKDSGNDRNLISFRTSNADTKPREEWIKSECFLEIDGKLQRYPCKKIQLDSEGKGKIEF